MSDNEDDYLSDEDNDYVEEIKQYNISHIMWDIRLEMIKYCERACIPLCQNLTSSILDNYIKSIEMEIEV